MTTFSRDWDDCPVNTETFAVDADRFASARREAKRGILGGGRVLVENETGLLFCRVKDDFDGWDVVGGSCEPDDGSLEATARREADEEVGLDVTITDLLAINRFSLEHDGETVTGEWAIFAGTTRESSLDVQTEELHEARWFESPPEHVNRHLEPALAQFSRRRR
ncbi:NUDIX domain-containing protein [Haloarchaeobius sp. HME9146]|uniref:NUDIX domain-containing protein n=1 Tax=Haloarchaeobius sp. HME9146 TaxID=2978732 RepID=UPI0021BE73B0|nr:NUDIX domain-containing protein [Haloarchaeobius sp. HME9146]